MTGRRLAATTIIALGGLLPAASATAVSLNRGVPSGRMTAKATSIDHCLVGTWHDNAGRSSTQWDGHKVTMHALGGDIDHIGADGRDHDNWMRAKPAYGTYQGHRLKEIVRGHNVLSFQNISSHKVRITEDGWTANSTNRYVYRGQHTTGYLDQTGHSTSRYSCTGKKLTFFTKNGDVRGTETRISRNP